MIHPKAMFQEHPLTKSVSYWKVSWIDELIWDLVILVSFIKPCVSTQWEIDFWNKCLHCLQLTKSLEPLDGIELPTQDPEAALLTTQPWSSDCSDPSCDLSYCRSNHASHVFRALFIRRNAVQQRFIIDIGSFFARALLKTPPFCCYANVEMLREGSHFVSQVDIWILNGMVYSFFISRPLATTFLIIYNNLANTLNYFHQFIFHLIMRQILWHMNVREKVNLIVIS